MRKLPTRTKPTSLRYTLGSEENPPWILFDMLGAENQSITPTAMGISTHAINTGNHSLVGLAEPELNSSGDTDRSGFSAR